MADWSTRPLNPESQTGLNEVFERGMITLADEVTKAGNVSQAYWDNLTEVSPEIITALGGVLDTFYGVLGPEEQRPDRARAIETGWGLGLLFGYRVLSIEQQTRFHADVLQSLELTAKVSDAGLEARMLANGYNDFTQSLWKVAPDKLRDEGPQRCFGIQPRRLYIASLGYMANNAYSILVTDNMHQQNRATK